MPNNESATTQPPIDERRLDEGREVTDDAIIGKALQALVDGPVAEGNSGVTRREKDE
jgi:hypothetical protein